MGFFEGRCIFSIRLSRDLATREIYHLFGILPGKSAVLLRK